MMVERLKHVGTSHSSSDRLKICVKMGASWSAQVFRQAADTVWAWCIPSLVIWALLSSGDMRSIYQPSVSHSLTLFVVAIPRPIYIRALECDQFGRTCDLISQGCDKKKTLVALVRPAIQKKKKKKSIRDSKSLLFDNRHVRLIAWSKPIRDSEVRTPLLIGRGSDIPVCVCAFEDACAAAVRQREVVEMRAALSLNLICSVSVWQSLQDSAIAEFIAKSSNLRYFPNCRRFCT